MKQLDVIIWADDTKDVPAQLRTISNTLVVCKTYKQTISALERIYENNTPKVLLCLDYHLGLKKTGTGMDIARYIVKHQLPLTCFWIVSIYPEGKKEMQDYLSKYYHYENSLDNVLKNYAVLPDITIETIELKDDICAEMPSQVTTEVKLSIFRRGLKWLQSEVSAFKDKIRRLV